MKKKQSLAEQTALVSFLAEDLAGAISEVKAENAASVHPKLAEESVCVIREGPNLIPAAINGKKAIYT